MFVDANLFISAAVDTEETGERARKLVQAFKKASTSPLVLDEVVWKLRKYDMHLREQVVNAMRKNPELIFKPIHATAGFEAFDLMRKHNLKPRDALHVAVMLANKETEILSNDPDFDRVPGITRIAF